MQTSSTMPQWAIDLVTQVCKDYKRRLPYRVDWYNSNKDGKQYTNGTTWTYEDRIFIRAGFDKYDQELVLLHELAHYIIAKSKRGLREGHSLRFWKLAFELYFKYGIEPEYAIYREENYKAKATKGYQYALAKKD